MPVYLAYQFHPSELTWDKLALLLDNYFDFETPRIKYPDGPRNSEELFAIVRQRTKQRFGIGLEEKLILEGEDPTILVMATYVLTPHLVKGHPLLEIVFANQSESQSHRPNNFTGLNIWPGHTGSEGLVDMIQFKPEMDNYLSYIGIKYLDRSKIKL